jgi:hypothetical protein
MNALFSDRVWILKLALAGGLFSLLCHRAEVDVPRVYPPPEAPARPGLPELGRTLYMGVRPVLATAPDGFDVQTRAGPCRILHPGPAPATGSFVSLVGVIEGPRLVRAVRIHPIDGWLWKRTANYAVSIATLLGCLWLARRRFRWRLKEGLFRSRA